MRPIDADTLLEKVEKIQPWEPYLGKYAQGIRHCMEIVSLLIKDAPTIESSAQQDRDIPLDCIIDEDGDAICPKCGANVEWHKYCEECGQALKWKEEL